MSAFDDKQRGAPETYALAFSEGVRALSERQAVIDSFRTRSGLPLSGAAIATSFLGQASLEGGTTFFTSIAIAIVRALGAAVIAILWPRDDWEYSVRPELLIANYIEHPEPLEIAQIHRDLALHMDRSYLRNRGQLLRLVWLFRAASVLLIGEVVAWVVDLIFRRNLLRHGFGSTSHGRADRRILPAGTPSRADPAESHLA